jgi:hypothetical protein
MNYTDPLDVKSPQDAITHIDVLFDGGEDSVSVAKIIWFGKIVIGMRWNVSMREWDDLAKINGNICLGNPVSRGYPTWFILPNELFDPHSDLTEILKMLTNQYLV